MSANGTRETATLGGGCFWCLEAVFEQLRGIERVESGYAGGSVAHPTYQQVCGGDTGHGEVVQITFDPAVLSFAELLDVFFDIHDPTTLNRQGADVGTQYRSAIFYHSPEQKRLAEEKIAALNASGVHRGPIVTQVVPFEAFYRSATILIRAIARLSWDRRWPSSASISRTRSSPAHPSRDRKGAENNRSLTVAARMVSSTAWPSLP
jgi:peptide-methionine (S)-S-oxide reductase